MDEKLVQVDLSEYGVVIFSDLNNNWAIWVLGKITPLLSVLQGRKIGFLNYLAFSFLGFYFF